MPLEATRLFRQGDATHEPLCLVLVQWITEAIPSSRASNAPTSLPTRVCPARPRGKRHKELHAHWHVP